MDYFQDTITDDNVATFCETGSPTLIIKGNNSSIIVSLTLQIKMFSSVFYNETFICLVLHKYLEIKRLENHVV